MEPKRFGKDKWNNKIPYVQSLGSLLKDQGSTKSRKDGKLQLGVGVPETAQGLGYSESIQEHIANLKFNERTQQWETPKTTRNPKFSNLLDKMAKIHNKKNQDYASDSNPYSNFEFAATYAQVPLYKVYLVLEGLKTARLHELLGKGKIPNNESTNDTWLDKATYAAIAASNLMNENENQSQSTPKDGDEV
jgi:hypothetical protein